MRKVEKLGDRSYDDWEKRRVLGREEQMGKEEYSI